MMQKACASSFWKTGSISEQLCGKNDKCKLKQTQTYQHKQSRINKGTYQVTILCRISVLTLLIPTVFQFLFFTHYY